MIKMIPNLCMVGICILATALLASMFATNLSPTSAQSPIPAKPVSTPSSPSDAPQHPPLPPTPTVEFNEHTKNPQKAAEPIPPPEPLDKTLDPIHPNVPPDIEVKPDLSETAKTKLTELENNIELINNKPTQSKEVEELKHLANNFYDRSVMYYKAGNYRLSIIYSQLSLEIIHAIEEIRR